VLDIRQVPVPEDASKTFHGRDVFAKAAANINQGRFETIGQKIKKIEKLELYLDGRTGIVVRIDSFGNIITNLAKLDKDKYVVESGDKKWTMRYYPNYGSAKEGELFLIEGSNNTLEISLKNASANDKLQLKPGKRISIS
jgi:S-adenosylmethionine hydrolase